MTTKLFIKAVTKFLFGVVFVGLLIFYPQVLFILYGRLFLGVLFVPMLLRASS